jgi:hypothetical protein
MNITQLREHVTEVLSASPNLVGEYTLPDGTRIPAIYVVGRQNVPQEWKATGLEVIIREFPERSPSAMVGMVKVVKMWEVQLAQYTTSEGNLSVAIDRLISRFPDAAIRYMPGGDIVYERCRIMIKDTEVRTLYPRYQ